MTRRGFGAALGAAAGAAIFDLGLAPRAAKASVDWGMPKDMVELNSNENPYGPSPAAREAMTRSQGVAGRYPDAAVEELQRALAKAHGVAPEQVLLGCGSGDILRMADGAFLAPDRKVVVAEPTFEAVLAYNRVTRAEPVKVPLDGSFRHDLARMAAACDAATGLVYVCNPNNPTGTIVTGDELAAFLDKVPHSVTVVLDEAYHHFVEHTGLPQRLRPPRRAPEPDRRQDVLQDLRSGGHAARVRGGDHGQDRGARAPRVVSPTPTPRCWRPASSASPRRTWCRA